MKRLEKFAAVAVFCMMLLAFMLLADVIILAYINVATNSDRSHRPAEYIADNFEKTVDENGAATYILSPKGMDRIDQLDGFVFLLNDAGDVVWSYRMPEDVPTHFTIRQIVRFSRFYLNDYPVFTHIIEDGILVMGRPKNSVWKYQLMYETETIEVYKNVVPVLFMMNAVILFVVPVLLIRRDSRRREMERTTWIAGVSHDIRTPLSLVLGYADEILHMTENGIVAERARVIEEQAVRIRTLVTNLNTENKLTFGMGSWHREKLLLPAIIRESICEIVNRNLDEKYDISVMISENLEQLSVNGDKELIKRLLENLINNAIKHNPNGCEIRVSLTWRKWILLKKYILEISDNGRGVSAKQLKSFRASLKSDKLPEHGLGIRLVRQIAAFHHWNVRFSNNKNGGFCCFFVLR